MTFKRRLDLPLARDGSGGFLGSTVALMAFLAGLALAAMMLVGSVVERWDRSLTGTMTVQLPPAASDKVEGVVKMLRAIPGVASAKALGAVATAALVEPWLGAGVSLAELPMPVLIDVKVDGAAPPELGLLRRKLAEAVPGATVDAHRQWLDRLLTLATAVEAAAVAIVALVGGAAVLIVAFTTRTGLAVHHGTIEVLHLIGAQDGYIARQFEWQALRLALRGGAVGAALAALVVFGLLRLAEGAAELRLFPDLALTPLQWAVFAALPVLAGLAAMATARVTVMRTLGRMP